MKKGYAAAVLAIVGVATIATLSNLDVQRAGTNFLQVDDSTVDIRFINYIGKYQKQYSTKEEFTYRMQVFAENAATIDNHNSQNSGSSYRMGLNKFSDMTPEEYQVRLGLKGDAHGHRKIDRTGENSFIVFNTTDLPQTLIGDQLAQ